MKKTYDELGFGLFENNMNDRLFKEENKMLQNKLNKIMNMKQPFRAIEIKKLSIMEREELMVDYCTFVEWLTEVPCDVAEKKYDVSILEEQYDWYYDHVELYPTKVTIESYSNQVKANYYDI